MLRIDAARLGELRPRFVDMRGHRQLVTFGELGDPFEQSLGATLRSRGTQRPMKPRRQWIQPFDLRRDECNVSLRVARLAPGDNEVNPASARYLLRKGTYSIAKARQVLQARRAHQEFDPGPEQPERAPLPERRYYLPASAGCCCCTRSGKSRLQAPQVLSETSFW